MDRGIKRIGVPVLGLGIHQIHFIISRVVPHKTTKLAAIVSIVHAIQTRFRIPLVAGEAVGVLASIFGRYFHPKGLVIVGGDQDRILIVDSTDGP